jgi:hypothetical protein
MKILRFEWKKFKKAPKSWILILLMFLFVFGIFLLDKQNPTNEILSGFVDSKRTGIEASIESTKNDLEKETDEKIITYFKESLAESEKRLHILNRQSLALNAENYLEYWKLEIQLRDLTNATIFSGNSTGTLNPGNSPNSSMGKEDNSYEELIRASIKMERKINPEVANPIKAFSSFSWAQYFSSIIFISLLVFLFGDILTADFENQSIYLYAPIVKNKGKLIFVKFFMCLLITIMAMIGFYLLDNALRWIFFGEGSLQNPIIFGKSSSFGLTTTTQFEADSNKEVILSTIQHFYLTFFWYSTIVFSFILSTILLLSVFLKKTLSAIGVFIVLLFTQNFLMDQVPQIAPFLAKTPFHFLNSFKVITYNFVFYNKNSVYIGGIYLTLLTIIFLGISYQKLKYSKFS